MLEIAALIAAVAAVVGVGAQMKATSEQNEAQRDAAKIQQRQAALENARRARRAVAEQRLLRAELIQNAATMDARTSSSTAGATGSLATQTAANIGAASTQLAGDVGINTALIRGARESAKWNTIAGGANLVSSIASTPQFGQGMQKFDNWNIGRQQRAFAAANTPSWIK